MVNVYELIYRSSNNRKNRIKSILTFAHDGGPVVGAGAGQHAAQLGAHLPGDMAFQNGGYNNTDVVDFWLMMLRALLL